MLVIVGELLTFFAISFLITIELQPVSKGVVG
jgi:hypothetical protein